MRAFDCLRDRQLAVHAPPATRVPARRVSRKSPIQHSRLHRAAALTSANMHAYPFWTIQVRREHVQQRCGISQLHVLSVHQHDERSDRHNHLLVSQQRIRYGRRRLLRERPSRSQPGVLLYVGCMHAKGRQCASSVSYFVLQVAHIVCASARTARFVAISACPAGSYQPSFSGTTGRAVCTCIANYRSSTGTTSVDSCMRTLVFPCKMSTRWN